MRIALAQVNTTVGDFQGNLEKIRDYARRAKDGGAELVVFPELAVTGYPPRDLLDTNHFIEKSVRAVETLVSESTDIALIVGFVAPNEGRGKPVFNAAACLWDGKLQFQYNKHLLPNYDVFDEERHFAAGSDTGVVTLNNFRLGVTICEDIWNDKDFWGEPRYHIDPISDLAAKKIEGLINLSASPYALGKEQLRKEMMVAIAKRYRIPVYFCNAVGGNDELVFDGRSAAVNSAGEMIAEAAAFQEDLLLLDDPVTMEALTDLRPEDSLESVFQALTLGVRDYVHKCGFQSAVLGLSGGIDSALTAVIAVEALGIDNVLGLLMPSCYSSPGSIADAQELASRLGIKTELLPIEGPVDAYAKTLQQAFADVPEDVTEENLQARIRGNLLMAFSNKFGHIVLSTGNKSELSVGYCTLYGDMCGGLAVLSDIPKTMVYELSRWVNRKRQLIPEEVLLKPPSAELRPNQKDQDSLPPYEMLDGILKAYIEDHLDREAIIAQGYDAAIVDDVIRRVVANEYKRRQMPVGIKVSKKAFGIGRRLPLAKKV